MGRERRRGTACVLGLSLQMRVFSNAPVRPLPPRVHNDRLLNASEVGGLFGSRA